MHKNRQFIITCIFILLFAVSCTTKVEPVYTPDVKPAEPATKIPSVSPPTPTASIQPEPTSVFPTFSLTYPDTVCMLHFMEGLSCVDASGWKIYKNDETSPVSTIPRVMVSCPDGEIYIADSQFYRLDGKKLVEIGGPSDQGSITCKNGLWATGFETVSHFDGSSWTRYTLTDYFPEISSTGSEYINSLAIAPNGDPWVITRTIIATYDGSKWLAVDHPGISAFSPIMGEGIAIDSNGVVWVITFPDECCTYSHISKYDGSQWTTFSPPDDEDLELIALDAENRLWASTTENNIYTFDPVSSEWTLKFNISQLGLSLDEHSDIEDMEFDRQGRLWLPTDYGVGVYDGADWTIYQFHTANLLMNESTRLFLLGNGPQLPPLVEKAPGSVAGRLVNETSSPFENAQVELCMGVVVGFHGEGTPCASQVYHVTDDVNPDGSFVITNVRTGDYYLMARVDGVWLNLVREDNTTHRENPVGFFVTAGAETKLGDIPTE